jgi:ribonucleoside-diphosphate reductase alpha chain
VESGSPEASRLATAAWETGTVVAAFDPRDAEAVQRAASAPRAALDVRPFWNGETFDAEGVIHLVRLWTLALEIETAASDQAWRPLALTLAGVGDLLVALGIAYASDEGRRIAASLSALASAAALLASAEMAAAVGAYGEFAQDRDDRIAGLQARMAACAALKDDPVGAQAHKLFGKALAMARKTGLRNAEVTALYEDADLSLRLGGVSLGASPWGGPLTVAETADGETVPAISEAAAAGLRALGVDFDEAAVHLLGRRELSGAPGVDCAALRA